MAESPKIQIPGLPPAANVQNNDLFIIRQGTEDKRVTFDVIKDNISPSDINAISVSTNINTALPLQGGGSIGGGLTLSIQDASTSQKGSTQYAIPAEVQAGLVNNKTVTPFGLASLTATETRAGIVERATDSEALTDDTTRYVNPKQLNARVNTRTTEARVLELINQERQRSWPIGSVYTNAVSPTNPSVLLGFGTWVLFGQGRVMVGVDQSDGNFNTVGKTGGSSNAVVVTHSHTAWTDPSGAHDHTIDQGTTTFDGGSSGDRAFQGNGNRLGTVTTRTTMNPPHAHNVGISVSGESGVGKNLQPYITVYAWQRTG